MSKKMKSNLLLLLTAFIWGTAFVAQKSGMDYIEPFTYGGIRTLIGGLFLIPVIKFLDTRKPAEEKTRLAKRTAEQKKAEDKLLLIGGICCGMALFVASTLQQFGLSYTTAGKAGFITTLYVVIVPIFSIFLRKKVGQKMWFCVMLGALGMSSVFKTLKKRMSADAVGGSPLIGVNGLSIIAHGSATGVAILNAIRMACELHENNVNKQIVETMGKINEALKELGSAE